MSNNPNQNRPVIQAASNAAAPVAAEPKKFELPDGFTLTLDRSRAFSEVHGDSGNLGFIQDGIPFDKGARLLKEALGQKDAAGDLVYPRALEVIERKVKRKEAERIAAERAKETSTENTASAQAVIDTDPDADVDLVAWAKGEEKLLSHVVYRVAQKRLGKHCRTFAQVAEEMVRLKMITEVDVKVA